MSWMKLYGDGKAKINGRGMPMSRVVKRTKEVVVLKVPGHKYWSSRCQQGYAPAEFKVFRVVLDDGTSTIEVHEITSFDVRS